MEPVHKLCPSCGAEFQPWVTQCSDCGHALQWATQLASESPAPLPHARELICVRVGDAREARDLAEALSSAGIPSRIDSHPPGSALDSGATDPLSVRASCAAKVGVYVGRDDVEAATAIEAERVARRTPELAALAQRPAPDANACPGCGAALDPTAPSCADCGLFFPVQ